MRTSKKKNKASLSRKKTRYYYLRKEDVIQEGDEINMGTSHKPSWQLNLIAGSRRNFASIRRKISS